ncbi:MAG: hypothetical protein WC091_11740 [Sulfuricellaceae bacterium]
MKPDTQSLPPSVQEVVEFLERDYAPSGANAGKIWFQLGRNPEVKSCWDAARHRQRLGSVGIPLCDELKSLVYEGWLEGKAVLVALHMRADRRIAPSKLGALHLRKPGDLVLDLNRLEVISHLGIGPGTVNPFLLESRHRQAGNDARRLIHMLDGDLLQPAGPPGTIMTNAGDLTWSCEFDPAVLPRVFATSIQADFTDPDSEAYAMTQGLRRRKSIGIITGNNPESGSLLWGMINHAVRRELRVERTFNGDISYPRTEILSIPEMGLTMELNAREGQVWNTIAQGVRQLRDVDFIAIACNTSQFFTQEIRALLLKEMSSGAGGNEGRGGSVPQYISMPECLAMTLKQLGIEEVSLLGISYINNHKYSLYFQALENVGIRVANDNLQSLVGSLAYQIKEEGANPARIPSLKRAVRNTSSPIVVLALTELSYLISQCRFVTPPGKIIIDALAIYAEAIAMRYLSKPFPKPDLKLEDVAIINTRGKRGRGSRLS